MGYEDDKLNKQENNLEKVDNGIETIDDESDAVETNEGAEIFDAEELETNELSNVNNESSGLHEMVEQISTEVNQEIGYYPNDVLTGGINKKIVAIVAVAVVALIAVISFFSSQPKSVEVSSKYEKICIDDSFALDYEIIPESKADKEITWTSSNPAVAKVDNKGKVTGVGEGTCTITARAGIKSNSVEISVEDYNIDVIYKADTKDMHIWEYFTVECNLDSENKINNKIEWSSSDESIAKVYDNRVEAVGEGECTITATCDKKSETIDVSVEKCPDYEKQIAACYKSYKVSIDGENYSSVPVYITVDHGGYLIQEIGGKQFKYGWDYEKYYGDGTYIYNVYDNGKLDGFMLCNPDQDRIGLFLGNGTKITIYAYKDDSLSYLTCIDEK